MLLILFLLAGGALFCLATWLYLVFVEYRINQEAEADNDETFNLAAAVLFAWVAIVAAARKFLQWIKSLV